MEELGDTRVATLLDATLALSAHHDVDAVLDRIAAAASRVADAQYAALAIYDERGDIERFLHHGLPAVTVAALGHPPVGRGLLGQLLVAAGPMRLDDLMADPRFTGFPDHHPPMRTFLGVPVRTGRRSYGNLYVTEKRNGSTFDEVDERLLVVLAAFAAAAVEGALLIHDERARAEAEAQLAAARQREADQGELLDRIIEAQEEERARVSRDLHDDVGQALTSVLLALRLVEDALAGDPPQVLDARDRTAEVRELVADALQTARTLAFELRPTVLDDLGLGAALRRLAYDTANRNCISVDVDTDGLDNGERLPGGIETVVYRIVQESLTNVARHAGATSASITLTLGDGRLRAMIEDDGCGFELARGRSSLGLRGMAERAALVGGSLVIESAPGAGTRVRLEVPHV